MKMKILARKQLTETDRKIYGMQKYSQNSGN